MNIQSFPAVVVKAGFVEMQIPFTGVTAFGKTQEEAAEGLRLKVKAMGDLPMEVKTNMHLHEPKYRNEEIINISLN